MYPEYYTGIAASALDTTTITVTDLQGLNFVSAVYLLVALAILAAGALSIIFIFYGGFSFILSGGDEGKVKEAIHTIRYAIIGLIITLLSLVVVPFVGRLFNVNFNFLNFSVLSQQINMLFTKLGGSIPASPLSAGSGTMTPEKVPTETTPAAATPVKPGVNVLDLTK